MVALLVTFFVRSLHFFANFQVGVFLDSEMMDLIIWLVSSLKRATNLKIFVAIRIVMQTFSDHMVIFTDNYN